MWTSDILTMILGRRGRKPILRCLRGALRENRPSDLLTKESQSLTKPHDAARGLVSGRFLLVNADQGLGQLDQGLGQV